MINWCSDSFRSTLVSLTYKLFRCRYTTMFELSVSIWKFTLTFLRSLYFVHFRQEKSSLEPVFSMFVKFCISTTVTVRFLGQVSGVVNTRWDSPNFDLRFNKRCLLSPMFQIVLTRIKRKLIKSKEWIYSL